MNNYDILREKCERLVKLLQDQISAKDFFDTSYCEQEDEILQQIFVNTHEQVFICDRHQVLLNFQLHFLYNLPDSYLLIVSCDGNKVYGEFKKYKVELRYTDKIGLFDAIAERFSDAYGLA
jgi:hypothetical protein